MPTTPRPRSRLLDAPPLALPRALDRVAERWAGAPPRLRLALGVLGAVAVLAIAGRGAARSPWGPTVPVVLAATDLAPGDVVAAEHVRPAAWPRALLPPSSVADARDVVGQVLAVGAPPGTPLTTRHIAPDGLAAELDDDRVAFPVPQQPGVELAPGQQVDVLAGAQLRGRVVASAATVLAVVDEVVWLAIDRADAPAVANAVGSGTLTLVLLPSPA